MSSYLTSNSLIASVKRRAMIPENQNTFSDQDFLSLANEEMALGLVPSVLQLNEAYFLTSEDIPLVSNQSEYAIPYRAIGNKLNEISYKDTNGSVYEMTRIEVKDLPDFKGGYSQGYQRVFYVKNNKIVLVPEVQGAVSGSLVMSYYMRPNNLVTEDRVAVITSINTTTGDISVSSIPSVFNASQKYDFVQIKSPHILLAYDLSFVSINTVTKVINFNPADLPSDLEVGDHINLATESIVPQVPSDLHVVLAHRVAARCIEAMGDTQALQNANAKLAEFESKTGNVIDNRVENAPLKIVNRHGLMRQGLSSRRYRRRY